MFHQGGSTTRAGVDASESRGLKNQRQPSSLENGRPPSMDSSALSDGESRIGQDNNNSVTSHQEQSLQHRVNNQLNNENTDQRYLKDAEKQDSKSILTSSYVDKSMSKGQSCEQSDDEHVVFGSSYSEARHDPSKSQVVTGISVAFTCSAICVSPDPYPCCGVEQCRQCFNNIEDSIFTNEPLPFH